MLKEQQKHARKAVRGQTVSSFSGLQFVAPQNQCLIAPANLLLEQKNSTSYHMKWTELFTSKFQLNSYITAIQTFELKTYKDNILQMIDK